MDSVVPLSCLGSWHLRVRGRQDSDLVAGSDGEAVDPWLR